MRHSGKTHHGNTVELNDNDVIVVTVLGPQDRESTRILGIKVSALIENLRAQAKKVHIYTDMSGLKMGEVTSSARQEARSMLSHVTFDKAAVFGKGIWVGLLMYLIKVAGVGEKVRFFTSKRRALSWLVKKNSRHISDHSIVALVAGVAVGLIGATALIGWQFDNNYLTRWISELRPMNPISAVGLIVAGFAYICFWTKRFTWLRWTGVFGIGLGVIALSPLSIDYLLYGSKVAAVGGHAEIADSAAICFIAMGIMALVAGRIKWWVRPLEYIAISIMIGLSGITIFGQLYAHEWIYSISSSFVMAFNLAAAFAIGAAAFALLVVYKQVGVNVLTRVTRVGWLIVIVLFLVQAATYAAWVQANARNQATASAAFRTDARDIEAVLEERFSAYINALYGFQGLYLASSNVGQGEFITYYNTTNVAKHYPGLRTLTFISKVSDAELPAFIKAQRADKSVHPEGNTLPNLKPFPGPIHYIFTYGSDPNAATGTDVNSIPDRLPAFQKAEATRQPVASGTLKFTGSAMMPVQNGFFITVPVATESEPNKVSGYVNAVFNYENFFADTFKQTPRDDLSIKITDRFDGKVVYNTKNKITNTPVFVYGVPIAVADRTWSLEVNAPMTYGNVRDGLPNVILASGQVLSLLLIIIFFIQARGRQQALTLADDITKDLQEERNRAVANNDKSQAILSSIGDGVFALDTKGHITVFNPAAETISGVSAEEAKGKPYDQLLHFVYQKNGKVNDAFIKRALGGRVTSMSNHTEIIRQDGKRVPVADSAAPIRDGSGKVIGAIVVFRDVSKEYELDKAKTEFVSLASHQLRTPLSAINWYGEMLLGGDAGRLNKNQQEYIHEIFEGSQRMVELVNSLLDVSRLEVGKLPDKPSPTHLPELVESLEKELTVSIKNKSLVVTKAIEKIPTVTADPKQLRMIFQNLMSNAVKYTPEKGKVDVALHVATAQEKALVGIKSDKQYWFFSVKDTGYGIPKEAHAKVFGKLFRADNVRKLDVEGTGLGLYIVKEVIEKMGGHVWFDSMESVGTTFCAIAPIEPKRKSDYNKS